MPSSNVAWPGPLTRLQTLMPGQMAVPGTDTETGLRLHSTGTIFYVDPNYPGVSDQRDGTDPNDPLRTVAAALTHCQPYRGDVIAVMANGLWTHANPASSYRLPIAENVIVTVPGIKIVGVFPSGSLGVPWYPGTTGGTCITVNAIDVLIEGFCFMDAAANNAVAIAAVWGGTVYGDNLTVRHCFFNTNLDYGIRLTFAYYSHIHDNYFDSVNVTAINDETANNSDYIEIYNNRFSMCTNAINLPGVSWGLIRDNWIRGNPAGANNYINLTGGADNIVANNYLGCNIGQYDSTCSDSNSGAWISNFCTNGPTTAPPT